MTSDMTLESLDDLGIKEGDTVKVVVKAVNGLRVSQLGRERQLLRDKWAVKAGSAGRLDLARGPWRMFQDADS